LHIQKHPLQPKLQIFYEFDFCYVLSKDWIKVCKLPIWLPCFAGNILKIFSKHSCFGAKSSKIVNTKTFLSATFANIFCKGFFCHQRLKQKCIKLLFWVFMLYWKNNIYLSQKIVFGAEISQIGHKKQLWQPKLQIFFEFDFWYVSSKNQIKMCKIHILSFHALPKI
jgi:hypothetical protein